MIIREMYHAGGETAFENQIKRIEEAAVDSIYMHLRLPGTDEWTEVLVKMGEQFRDHTAVAVTVGDYADGD